MSRFVNCLKKRTFRTESHSGFLNYGLQKKLRYVILGPVYVPNVSKLVVCGPVASRSRCYYYFFFHFLFFFKNLNSVKKHLKYRDSPRNMNSSVSGCSVRKVEKPNGKNGK